MWYESIDIKQIDNHTVDKISNVFSTNNIEALIMKNNKKKIIYLDDNVSTNLKIFKKISSISRPIIITMSKPISSKFYKYIESQYHIILDNNICDIFNNCLKIDNKLDSKMDKFYYNIFEVINNIIEKK